MPSLYDLLVSPDPQTEAAALQDALRKRAARGSVLQMTGDRVLAPAGAGMVQSAGQGQAGIAETVGARLRQAMEAQKAKVAQGQWEREQTEKERHNTASERIMANRPASQAFLPPRDLDAIADAMARGELPPVLTPFRSNAAGIAARLAKRGTNVSEQQLNFDAEKKAVASLNGTQQVRLRQTMATLDHSLGLLDQVYDEWQKVGPASGFRKFNRAALATAQQMPGKVGATAQKLNTLINDMVAETANVYMGGNSPTDHALKLAAENLKADWNEETFKELLGLMRKQLGFRRQAMEETRAAGARGENQYAPEATAPAPRRRRYNPATGALE
jgi:hypothetical protein